MPMSASLNYYQARAAPLCNRLLLLAILANAIFATLLLDEERNLVILINYLVALLPLAYAFYKQGIHITKLNISILSFLCYLLLIVLFSSNKFLSFNYYVKLFLGMIMFPFFYSLNVTNKDLQGFCVVSLIILIYGNIYFSYSNLTEMGYTVYDAPVYRGYAHLSTYYTYILSILIIPIAFILYDRKRWIRIVSYLLICSTAIAFILIFRRSNILLLVFGSITYALLAYNKSRKMASFLFLALCVLLVGSLFFGNIIEKSFYARQARFSPDWSIEHEARFQENIYVYNTLTKSPAALFFGSGELFNSRGKYGWPSDRQLHNAYANLAWSSGLVGLFWYCFIVGAIFRHFWIIRNISYNNLWYFTISNVALTIVSLGVLSWFMGSFPSVTYGSYYWGSLGLLLNYLKSNLSSQSASYKLKF